MAEHYDPSSAATVLVASHSRHFDLVVNGTKVARFYARDDAHHAARLTRGSLAVGLPIPFGLFDRVYRWLGAPYDQPDAA